MFWHCSFLLIWYPCSIGVQKYKCMNENKVIVNTTLLEYQVLFTSYSYVWNIPSCSKVLILCLLKKLSCGAELETKGC